MKIEKELYDLEKNQAIDLFNKILPNKSIISIEKIHLGLTNISFKVQDNDSSIYQVRIGMNNEYVDRQNELNVLKNINNKNYLYFNEGNGQAIKKWINGQMVDENEIDIDFLIRLNEQITEYHKTELKYEVKTHNYYEFVETFKYIDNKYISEYIEIIDSYNGSKLVLSHNDLNPKNIIIDEKKGINFIDFEWGRLNYEWYDICNFIRETNISFEIIKEFAKYLNKELVVFLKEIFVCLCFAMQWTYTVEQLKEIIEYREDVFKKMEYYYNLYKNIK